MPVSIGRMKPVERVEAAIGLGSNLDDPAAQVEQALAALDTLPHTRLVKRSRLYRSRPQGPQDQPDFVNACAVIETALGPEALLDALQAIERQMGRVRQRHWGERVIDLDLLLYGELTLATPRLTVPHPWMHRRDFVLVPLADIAPDWPVPGMGRVRDVLARLDEYYLEDKL